MMDFGDIMIHFSLCKAEVERLSDNGFVITKRCIISRC